MGYVTPETMRRILAITDALGVHRERVRVPLAARGDGGVRWNEAGVLEIVVPEGGVEEWLGTLEEELRRLRADGT